MVGVVDLGYEYEFEVVRVDRKQKEGRCISCIIGSVLYLLELVSCDLCILQVLLVVWRLGLRFCYVVFEFNLLVVMLCLNYSVQKHDELQETNK